MCNEAKRISPDSLQFVPSHFQIQKMCDKAVRRSHALVYVPDRYNTEEMHKNVVRGCRYVLEFVPDWSVTQEMCENMETHEE